MGGPHSEPATLLDSSFFAERLHRSRRELRRVGLAWKGLGARQAITAFQHVGDMLALSGIWCPD
eukprot:7766949-Alexandrium_andersonii.AAC.1